MDRRIITVFVLLIGFTASIFYFMQNDRNDAINAIFLGVYFAVSIYLILRILFYFKHKATINEMFFVIVVNSIAILLIVSEPYVPLGASHQFGLRIAFEGINNIHLYVSLISYLALPYFLLSLILQIRAFTKYEFFRISPTSEKGIPAEFIAFLVYFIVGILFIFVGNLGSDLISVLFGIYYIFTGAIYLIAR